MHAVYILIIFLSHHLYLGHSVHLHLYGQALLTSNNACANLLRLGQFGVLGAVEGLLELVAHRLCEPLSRCPVGHLPERNGRAPRIKPLRL